MFKFLKFLIALALIVILVYFGHGFILDKAGRFLYQRDELKPVDVIVVLGGEPTERVEHAVRLFREGWARKDKIIFSGGPVVWKHTHASLMQEYAFSLGIPNNAVILEDKSYTTEDNARFTKEILQKYGFTSCILVTSPYHSRMASEIFKKILGDEIRMLSSPSEQSWFTFEKWWKRKRDREVVLNEFSKFFWFRMSGGKE